MTTNVAFYTFGCKVNLFETEQLKASLPNINIVNSDDNADYYIINSCTVTSATDSQVRNMIRRFSKRGTVIVTGCYTRKKDKHLEHIDNVIFLEHLADVTDFFHSNLIYSADFDRARPTIKIQDGCNQFCSYCIIPSVRGSQIKSIHPSQIFSLLNKLKSDGFNEVVFSGIHLGKYGVDLSSAYTLGTLIRESVKIIPRIRLGSLESIEVDSTLISAIKDNLILPHFHIPLQYAANSILQRMNRPYSIEKYTEKLLSIYNLFHTPPAIGTDIIVGFPGETDEEFSKCYNVIESLPFTYGHVFPFSPREGTKAFDMHKKAQVSPEIIKYRAKKLRELFAMKNKTYINMQKDKPLSFILEEQLDSKIFTGTDENYIQATFYGKGFIKELKKVSLSVENGKIVAYPDKST